jgi:hypothetical protein
MQKTRHHQTGGAAAAVAVALGAVALGAVAMAAPSMCRAQAIAGAALPSADQVLAKYETFLGGAAALSKVTTRTITFHRLELGASPKDNLQIRQSKEPWLSLMQFRTVDDRFFQYVNGCDQAGPWSGAGLGVAGPLKSGVAVNDYHCGQDLYAYGYIPLNLARMKAAVARFEVKALITIVPTDPGSAASLAGGKGGDLMAPGPRQVYLVLSVPAKPTDVYAWLYFDAKTGALVRRADAGKGPKPAEPGMTAEYTDFIQYRDVGDGTRMPFQYVTVGPHDENRGVYTSVVDNKPLTDEALRRPKDPFREDRGY